VIRYIIVDDEPLAHDLIEQFCKLLPHLQLQKNCYSALDALQYLSSNTTDIMFLDLNMPGLKGFDFLRTLPRAPHVIVTTAYKEFALEGYELNVVDYLMKPFSFERLVQAINKAIGMPTATASRNESVSSEGLRFFVKGDKKYHQVSTDDILLIEAYGNYTKIFLGQETIISHEKISYYSELLPAGEFLRVHKSFLVARRKIQRIEGNRIVIGKHQVPIGQTYKSEVNKLLNF
jgi:DNA-binding LytR/AlgR family response regulator